MVKREDMCSYPLVRSTDAHNSWDSVWPKLGAENSVQVIGIHLTRDVVAASQGLQSEAGVRSQRYSDMGCAHQRACFLSASSGPYDRRQQP